MLSFYNGNSAFADQAPYGAPTSKAFFSAHSAFASDAATGNLGVAAVFPGRFGLIEGYAVKFVYNNLDLPDTTGPVLVNDTTHGVTGWLNLVFDGSGSLISGFAHRDNNGSFGPYGSVRNLSSSAFDIESDMVFHVSNFTRGTSVGDSCVARVIKPAGTNAGGQIVPTRMGEAQFVLQLKQQ